MFYIEGKKFFKESFFKKFTTFFFKYSRSSVVSSAQQVQRFTFPSRSPSSLVEENTGGQLQDEVQDIYAENDSDMIGPDDCRRSSDLYSPELNLEAHRTAQEVYNSSI